MPLYEYKCQTCSHRFERIERASSQHDGECPECGGVASRLLGTPALQFKGSGWYVTDYGNGNGNGDRSKPSDSETASASAPRSTGDAKSDTKPATDSTKKTAPKVA